MVSAQWELSKSGSEVTGAFKILRIVNLGTEIDNAWGDAYTIVQVQISQHQFVADKALGDEKATNSTQNVTDE